MIWLHHLVGTTLVNLEDIEKMCEHCRTIHVNSAHLASWSSYEPRKVEWRPLIRAQAPFPGQPFREEP